MASFTFDAANVSPQAASTPIPAGTYQAYIIASDIGATKAGNGQIMKLTFEVLDGQFKGRKVFENLNIQNSNVDTQRIAQSQLSAICHSVNVIKLQNTESLHFKPLKLKVSIDEAKNGYEARNRIRGYESVNPGTATAMPPTAVPTAPAANTAPVASGAPAWARSKAA